MKSDDIYEMDGTLAGGDGRLYECLVSLADGVWEAVQYLAIMALGYLFVVFFWGWR